MEAETKAAPVILDDLYARLVKKAEWEAAAPITEDYKRQIAEIKAQAAITFEKWIATPENKRAVAIPTDTAKAEQHTEGQEAKPPQSKSLYDEFQEFRAKDGEMKMTERAERLEQLEKEKAKAVENAKRQARQNVSSTPLTLFKTSRLTSFLEQQEKRKLCNEVYEKFKEIRKNVLQSTRQTGYVEWLKEKAVQGDTRAITTLRNKGETAPELIAITARDLKDAKTIVTKIEAVTGKGTLFYKAGQDVYRDDGKYISLKNDVTDAGIKNALLLAAAKFNSPLTLNGTEEFKQKCVDIARRERLKINFENPELDAARQIGNKDWMPREWEEPKTIADVKKEGKEVLERAITEQPEENQTAPERTVATKQEDRTQLPEQDKQKKIKGIINKGIKR